ncbi:MAG: HAD family hydrolase [Halieaceae bacterium]|jgi:FMN hydrolase / 5-amino-6-(5-phospho-D-ribitylamino)uracil phosphatase|nr:HAD family hydrolase [Halieaceae bacterium]
MNRSIKVITFDLDNTLWDVTPTLLKAEQAQRDWLLEHRPGAIEQHDHQSLWELKKSVWKRNTHLAHQISKMRIQFLVELQCAAGYSEANAIEGAKQAFQVFLRCRHAVVLYEEALDVLQLLARTYTLGALTNGNADVYKTDAGEYFDFAFLAEELNASKPAPDMFHAALRHSGVSAEQIIHVGDNPDHDIAGAQSVGMHTIWMNSQGEEWSGGDRADREIDNLQQLPEAIEAIAEP